MLKNECHKPLHHAAVNILDGLYLLATLSRLGISFPNGNYFIWPTYMITVPRFQPRTGPNRTAASLISSIFHTKYMINPYLNSSAWIYSTNISFPGWISNNFKSRPKNSVGRWLPYTPPTQRSCKAWSMMLSATIKSMSLDSALNGEASHLTICQTHRYGFGWRLQLETAPIRRHQENILVLNTLNTLNRVLR